MVFTLLKTHGIHFYLCPCSPLKLQAAFFIKAKGVEKTMICFIKIQSENMKMTWEIGLFIFSLIYNQKNIYNKLKTDQHQGNKIKTYQCSKKLVTERIQMF